MTFGAQKSRIRELRRWCETRKAGLAIISRYVRFPKDEEHNSHTIRNKRMKAFLSASPCIFFENETLFHEGENSWAGREKSSHFSILKEKYSVASDTIAFILEF